MGLALSPRQIGWALVALTAVAIALTVVMVSGASHAMEPLHLAPASILILVTAVWPFANGWRPFGLKAMRTCGACGTQWSPAQEGGARSCPACGSGERHGEPA